MRLSFDAIEETVNVIRGYDQGYVTINEHQVRRSLIVTPDRLITDWPPRCFTELEADHFEMVRNLRPEILLLGTGARQHFPHPRLTRPLVHQGIGLEAMDTAAACRTYNIILSEGRRVVAALFMI